MISIGQQIRLLIEEKLKNADFSRRKLSQGLCSRDTFAGLLEGSDITDPRFLKIIFQRLGKSPNKLEHIVPKSFIEITKLQYDFDDSIDRRDSENARTLMQEIEKFAQTCSFAKIRLMYIHRNRAAYEYYINGDPDTALEEIKAAINITLPKVSAENFANYAVSSVEMENILFYCLMLLESGDSNLDNNSFVRCFLGSLKDYAASNTTDPEEFAAIMPKIKWLSACLCLLEHRENEAVKECSDGLELLREQALLQMSLPFLEVITKHGKNTGLPNSFEDYASFKELLERLNDKYMSPKAHFDSLFFNTERAIYHYEAEVYSAQRKITKRTQEDIAGCVDVEPNVISRYEKGRRSPGKNTFPSLMAALELDRTRQGPFAQILRPLNKKGSLLICTLKAITKMLL